MEFSRPFHSLKSNPSPDGALVASLSASSLELCSTSNLEAVRTISLDAQFASRASLIRWSAQRFREARNAAAKPSLNGIIEVVHEEAPNSGSQAHSRRSSDSLLRILLADDKTIHIWDVSDEQWSATIDGAGSGVGKVANVEFSHNGDEVLVFSEFGVKVTAWSLKSNRSVEIRDPKFSKRGFEHRPRTGHLALLTRPAAHDVVTLHAPTSYKLLNSFTLPTIDAQGLRWSPDGRWIAVWDAASSGYKILVFTADGHLYRTYSGYQDEDAIGLGIKSVEWSPRGDYLAIGDHDNRVVLLSNITFAPTTFLDHTTTIKIPHVSIWQEQVSGSGERSYSISKQPMCPPSISSLPTAPNPQIGISIITFTNPNGRLVATRIDSMPTTVWIWSLELMSPYAILVQHSTVKSLLWHPKIPDLLMIICVQDDGIVYLWSAEWSKPQIFAVPLEKVEGKFEARWLGEVSSLSDLRQSSAGTSRPTIAFSDASRYVLGYVQSTDEASALDTSLRASQDAQSPSGVSNQDASALFDSSIQEGENRVSSSLDSPAEDKDQALGIVEDEIDDTFQHRRQKFP